MPVLLCLSAAPGVWFCLVWTRKSYDPRELKLASEYLVLAPRLLKYCFVPLGTSEAVIRARFGEPTWVLRVSDGRFQRHIDARTRHGQEAPEHAPTDRAIVYRHGDGIDHIEVYYFIDGGGGPAETFVGE